MYYYEVGVEKLAVKNQSLLTYESQNQLQIGSVVRVPLGKKSANGIVFKGVKKPKFATRSIDEVINIGIVPGQLIKTAHWMSQYYQADIPGIVSLLIPRGAHKTRRQSDRVTSQAKLEVKFQLNEDQSAALKTLQNNQNQTAILHGITGSGKTLVYIERAKDAVANNKGVIVLVPEIGLTSQVVEEFKKYFDNIYVLHSNLSEPERHKTWADISKSDNPIVIGARSALFAPIKNLGLIVIDEAHETAYKQDRSPRYLASRVASVLSKEHDCQLILGSATPLAEDFYLAKKRQTPIIEMKTQAKTGAKSVISVVDLKDKANFKSTSRIFSKQLIDAISQALMNDKQVLVFHNRRGSSTSVVCSNCGWLADCPNCLLPLTHHHDSHNIICHICNYSRSAPTFCPECRKPELKYKGFGTKQIVSETAKLFPKASIARFDGDTKSDRSLENRYQELREGRIDIIVGTQMIAKGLDLPKLEVVGVVLADTTLYLPDFSANERTFQLLHQVSGRVGRHSVSSSVIIQTYTPDHPAIEATQKRSYDIFYSGEIAQRKLTNYPPFTFLLSLHAERSTQKGAEKSAHDLVNTLIKDFDDIEVLGPTPAFREKTRSGYRWQIVIKSKNRHDLLEIAGSLPDKWQFDIDPINLLA